MPTAPRPYCQPRFDLTPLRWPLAVMYGLGLFGFLAMGMVNIRNDGIGIVIIFAVTACTQVGFVAAAGTRRLCFPISPRRLIAPCAVAALGGALLVFGMELALMELFELDDVDEAIGFLIFGGAAVSWLLWGAFFFLATQKADRFHAMRRMLVILFVAALVMVIAMIPMFIIASRRTTFLSGLVTMLAIMCGIYIMFWSIGPAIALLFLRRRYRRESHEAAGGRFCFNCDYDLRGTIAAGRNECPECGQPVTSNPEIPKSANNRPN